jgi:hypothetical protein
MAKREKRVGVTMTATLSDGTFVFEGSVENVSRTGFKMTDIPAKFDAESPQCTAVITHEKQNYKMAIRPTWSTEAGIYKVVGFEIVSPPAEWIAVLDELDPAGRVVKPKPGQPEQEETAAAATQDRLPGVRLTLPGS